jgi:hypothetical protein
MSVVARVKFTDYKTSLTKALDLIKVADKLPQTFKANGYTNLADKYGIRLIDFNEEKAVVLKNIIQKRLNILFLY